MKISIWNHLLLLIVSRFGGAWAAVSLVGLFCGNVPNGWIWFAIAAPALLIGWEMGGRLLNWAFVARCTHCGGPTICEEEASIQYRCQVCKHVAITGVRSEGD